MIRTKKYTFIEKKLNDTAWRGRFPLRVLFELTYRCNFKCIHCYVGCPGKTPAAGKELETQEVFSILAQLKRAGTWYLGFTGGEIFLRKDIFEILRHAKKLGFQVIVLTNGSLIDEQAADELKRLSPNKVDITVHAMDRSRFDAITGVAGSAKKVFRAITLLRQRNVSLGLKSCGMLENRDEIIKISRFARSRNIRFRLDNELMPRLDRSLNPLKHQLLPEEGFLLHRACYPEMFRRPPEIIRSRRRDKGEIFSCGCGYTHLAIGPSGALKTCVDIDYPRYDLLKKPLKKGWEKIKKFVDTLAPPKGWACYHCDLAVYCSWCPAKSYLRDGTFFSCDAQSRNHAEYAKKMYAKRAP